MSACPHRPECGRGRVLGHGVRRIGTIACLLALLLNLGAHWLVLQSVAWGRMLVDFSRRDSLSVAISKTFSGEHPCSLCIQIQEGRQEEKEEERRQPMLSSQTKPEFLPAAEGVQLAVPPLSDSPHTAFTSHLDTQWILSPPKPPPRVVS